MPKFTVGILGGMGPAASAFFHTKLVEEYQTTYGAIQDTDFPNILHYSIGLEGFDETGIVNKELVKEQIKDAITLLTSAGAQVIVIPCNTVHLLIEELREYSTIPILSIIEETTKTILQEKESVLVLASQTTLKMGIYQEMLNQHKVKISQYSNQSLVTDIIMQVMQGKINFQTKQELIDSIEKSDSSAVLLACTELPLAISSNDVSKKIHDSVTSLVKATAQYIEKKKMVGSVYSTTPSSNST